MNFFKSDLFKIIIVVVFVLVLLFVMVDKFVMHSFSLAASLQDRNEQLNRKMTEIILVHKRTQRVVEERFASKQVECVAEYIAMKAQFLQIPTIKRIAANISKWSDKYNVPISLAVALAQERSNFNPTLVGPRGERGVFQIAYTGANAREIHAIEKNIKDGIRDAGIILKNNKFEAIEAFSVWAGHGRSSTHAISLATCIYEFDMFRAKFTKDWFNTVNTQKAIAIAIVALEQEAKDAEAKAKAKADKKETPK